MAKLCIKQNKFKDAERYFKELSMNDNGFLKRNEEQISSINRILYEGADKNNFFGLLNEEVKWKVN